MVKPQPTTAAVLPAQIEIFRAGQHTDDSGTVHNFSAADVQGMVTAYSPALREAPLTVGHPEHNRPAYGWVKGLAINDAGRLVMDTHQVQPQFAEMVAARLFKKRSASFYPPGHASNPKPGNWYLRHVAFLGAQPPAIAGLADFADTDATGAVNFSETPDPATDPANLPNNQEQRMTQELSQQLAAAQAALTQAQTERAAAEAELSIAHAQVSQFAEAAKAERSAGFVSFAQAQVLAGKLLPKDQAAYVGLLEIVADAKPVSFAEGGATKQVPAVDLLKALVSNAKPVVSFGESAAGGAALPGTQAAGQSDAEIDTHAKAYAKQHKVSYAEALTAVTTFTA